MNSHDRDACQHLLTYEVAVARSARGELGVSVETGLGGKVFSAAIAVVSREDYERACVVSRTCEPRVAARSEYGARPVCRYVSSALPIT